MTRLKLNVAGGDEMASEEPMESKVLSALGAFLSRHGFATVIALWLVWTMTESQKGMAASTADELGKLNTHVSTLAIKLAEHHLDGQVSAREVERILLAQCLNMAADGNERARCLGQGLD